MQSDLELLKELLCKDIRRVLSDSGLPRAALASSSCNHNRVRFSLLEHGHQGLRVAYLGRSNVVEGRVGSNSACELFLLILQDGVHDAEHRGATLLVDGWCATHLKEGSIVGIFVCNPAVPELLVLDQFLLSASTRVVLLPLVFMGREGHFLSAL